MGDLSYEVVSSAIDGVSIKSAGGALTNNPNGAGTNAGDIKIKVKLAGGTKYKPTEFTYTNL